MSISIEEFFELRKTLPIADVRSEGEFEAGHIAGAVNIPILNNHERVLVGTDYKQKGQLEAIKTGFRLVGPRLLEIINEAEKVTPYKELLVHCWRGGMRSSNFSQFVGMAGIKTHALKGGYKAYRYKALASFAQPLRLVLLTGCTGSGKSEILRMLKTKGAQVLDLETLASHKGSAFGGLFMPPQPTTEQFQNNLFEALQTLDTSLPIWVEDESIAIGQLFLPRDFWLQMNKSPLVQLTVAKEIRVHRLVNEYGAAPPEEFLQIMQKITKRLGGQNFNLARERLMARDMAGVINLLLTYYDKAYLHSIDKRKARLAKTICWNGEEPERLVNELILHSNVQLLR
ncbi:MAG: tRNA 2-selenouridine(34) synthase MnmH [Cyclobacteriaceae bacterium]|nr:tRNA 2-selenouridine(34) synthase MnmH [Cyclobacteriaceae bacterium]